MTGDWGPYVSYEVTWPDLSGRNLDLVIYKDEIVKLHFRCQAEFEGPIFGSNR